MLQQLMSSMVLQPAGLNAKGARAARPQRPNHYLVSFFSFNLIINATFYRSFLPCKNVVH